MTVRLYRVPRAGREGDPPGPVVAPLFADPYLELVRLLTEAAQLEHSLLIAYLRALFSIKDRYAAVRGRLGPDSFLERDPGGPGGTEAVEDPYTFLDVALEEMQHLDAVNRFLAALHASPCLVPHPFPLPADIYPFAIEALSLDRYAAATFLWLEADQCALSLSPGCAGRNEADPAFIREVRGVLEAGDVGGSHPPVDEISPDHVGSLYHRILDLAATVARRPPPDLPADLPWGSFRQAMHFIAQEGESGHYRFFRDVFTGQAFGGDASVWTEGSDAYPSVTLRGGTAYPSEPSTIPDTATRRLAWFADLHYWIVLTLLDARYRVHDRSLVYHGVDLMTRGLVHLGEAVAGRGHVLPFDALGPGYALGRGQRGLRTFAAQLLEEARRQLDALDRAKLLPAAYDANVLATVSSALAAGS